jgi:F0F1-type ATP synthase assembly protein I
LFNQLYELRQQKTDLEDQLKQHEADIKARLTQQRTDLKRKFKQEKAHLEEQVTDLRKQNELMQTVIVGVGTYLQETGTRIRDGFPE